MRVKIKILILRVFKEVCREKLGFVVFGHDLLGFFMTEIGGAL